MKRLLYAALALSLFLVLPGCGSDHSPPPSFSTQILSSLTNDGEIQQDILGNFIINQGNLGSLFVGESPTSGTEFRSFLDFPLTGAGGVPGNAIIDKATLDIFINGINIQATATAIPVRVELVPYGALGIPNFSQAGVAGLVKTFNILPTDLNTHVLVNVDQLMAQAQISGLSRFQVRLMEDFGPGVLAGSFSIDDTTPGREPLLEVIYH